MKIKFLTIMAAVAMFSCGEVAEKVDGAVEAGTETVEAGAEAAVETGTDVVEAGAEAVEAGAEAAVNAGEEVLDAGVNAVEAGAEKVKEEVIEAVESH